MTCVPIRDSRTCLRRSASNRERSAKLESTTLVGSRNACSRSHDAVIRVYDGIGNVIEIHEHAGDFKEFREFSCNGDVLRDGSNSGLIKTRARQPNQYSSAGVALPLVWRSMLGRP
jgi:hypothetical protein